MISKRRRPLSPTPTAGANRKEATMMYRVKLSQFVENGAAVLAERARMARLTAHKYELLRNSRCATAEPCTLNIAA
jgi:hypothetical protein